MTVELTIEQIRILIEIINTVNFPGREVEKVFEVKKIFTEKIREAID